MGPNTGQHTWQSCENIGENAQFTLTKLSNG